MNKNEAAALLAAFGRLRKKDRVFVMAVAQGLMEKAVERARAHSTKTPYAGGAQ